MPSSTPLSRELDPVLHLEDAGAAAIVMHSLFEEDVRCDERMMDRFLIHPESFGEAFGHLPGSDDYVSKLDAYLEQIQRLKSRLGIPVIASLNGSSLDGWVELGREMQDAGADTVDANLQLGFPVDARNYDAAIAMLKHFALRRIRLLTNNQRKIDALNAANILVTERRALWTTTNPHNAGYLQTKQDRMGHFLRECD